MLDPLILFIIVGQISIASFKGAMYVMKSTPSYWPVWALKDDGYLKMNILRIVSGVVGTFVVIYGFYHLEWIIVLISIVIIFPFTYVFIIRRITGDIVNMTFGSMLSFLGGIWVSYAWLIET